MADTKYLNPIDASDVKVAGQSVYHPGNPPPGGGGGSSEPPHITPTNGAYGFPGSLVVSARNTQPLIRDRIIFMPFYCDKTVTISELMVNCSTAQADSTTRLGVCEWTHTNSTPGNLVTDFGTVDTTTTGMKIATGSASVSSGNWYAFMLLSGGGTAANGFSNLVGTAPNDTRVKTAGTNFTNYNYSYINDQAAQRTGGFTATQSGTLQEQYGYMAGSFNMVFCTFS